MPVSSIVLGVADVARSVDFYTTHLRAGTVEVGADRAVLDVTTATLELVAVGGDAPASTWSTDDTRRGFRHVGFKVDHVDPVVTGLRAAGVRMHLEPLEAEGDVRIAFFPDPDGTMLELVERDLRYTQVLDEAGVAAERALGVPDRPRFDHVALTVADLDATRAVYAPLGFTAIGTIAQPADPRGFEITYLRGGETVLEVFTYATGTTPRDPQLDAPGFVAAVLTGAGSGQPGGGRPGGAFAPVGSRAGHAVLADADGFPSARAS